MGGCADPCGREALSDASRIAELRMGDLVIKVRPGSKVRVQQLKHEFLFGTAIPNQLARLPTRGVLGI